MRLNRGTILLAIALIIVIVAAALVSNNQPDTASPTAIPTQETVNVFSGLDSTHAVRLAVMNNISNNGTVLEREPSLEWVVTQATGATVPTENRVVDQTQIPTLLGKFSLFASPQSFDSDQLDTYGLAAPSYTITLTMDDGTTHTVYVGKTNLSGGRFYAVVESGESSGDAEATLPPTEAASATPTPAEEATAVPVEGTPEPSATPAPSVSLSGTKTVYLLATDDINALTALVSEPPYLPLPTATPTEYPTANPVSEVDQTATAAVDQTATSDAILATVNAMATLTPAATDEAAISTPEATMVQPTATP
ncbi:MAG: DUF4340 domain-containing protein [Anaerolineae bacterium]|nr:DUF4340 domain-containing protein [Anaerolineae bacterium]